jgi:hypothetical protein
MPRLFVPSVALCALLISDSSEAFSLQLTHAKHPVGRTLSLNAAGKSYFDEDEEEREREFAKVRRGGSRRDDEFEEEFDPELYRKVDAYLSDNEESETDEWDQDDARSGVIPNALLDSIDPEGAAERFPELIQDPKFWFDIGLFFLLLSIVDNVSIMDNSPFGIGP